MNNLSNLYSETFTIINQIPTSQSIATKQAWEVHKLKQCDRKYGIYDETVNTMVDKASSWTAYCKDWENYKEPLWTEDGYYTLATDKRQSFWTANVGDLLIFQEIKDTTPTTVAEFNTLVQKYKNNGGLITGTQAYINYKSNGTPWDTNHIEMIKG